MSPNQRFLLLACFLLVRGTSAVPEVILSSNVTSVTVGQSVSLRCVLQNYQPTDEEEFYVNFDGKDEGYFCDYYISVPDSTGVRNITFANVASTLPSLRRQSLSSTFPVYEITITPTTSGAHEYYCFLQNGTASFDVTSNYLSITATPHPAAVLTADVTSVVKNQPFTVSCSFASFNPLPVEYQVTFSSLREGQLAYIGVSGGKALLHNTIRDSVEISSGPRAAFPVFDLIITEKVDGSTVYWCDLEETGKSPVVSGSWPAFLTFTSGMRSETERLGTCAVGQSNVNVNGKPYSVQFYSDLGPNAVNLLGEYVFKPTQIDEFKSNPRDPWTSVNSGPNTTWPVFSILADGTALHGTWWCLLVVGAQGTPEYQEFKSNIAPL